MINLHKFLLVGVGFVVGVLAFGTAKFVSAHGGDLALIHACVRNSNGNIRIVGATTACDSNETALDWNLQGIQGPAGPQGPAGSPGPSGPPGTSNETPISVGGGLSGRWEGTINFTSDPDCNPFDPNPIKAVLVEDSADNLSGTFGFQQITSDPPEEPRITDYTALIGKASEPQIEFLSKDSQWAYTGTVQDQNTIGGIITIGISACTPSWSMQRVPALP
jgi:hypothetical protein